MRIKVSHPIVFILILGLALLCPIIYVIVMLDCERDIKSPPQVVDVSPLVVLNWPSDVERITDVIDPNILESHEIALSGRSLDGTFVYSDTWRGVTGVTRLHVWLVARSSADSAKGFLADQCANRGSYHNRSEFINGEAGDTEYCISYVREGRSDISGFCLPLGVYESMVVIRKRNVVIVIDEATGDKANMHTNEAIRRLAEALADQKPGNGEE